MKMNKEITQAIIELKQAEQNFQYAAHEFVGLATLQLVAAEMKVDTLLNLRNQKGPTAMDPLVRENTLTKTFDLIVPQQEPTVNRKIQVKAVNLFSKSSRNLNFIGKNF